MIWMLVATSLILAFVFFYVSGLIDPSVSTKKLFLFLELLVLLNVFNALALLLYSVSGYALLPLL